MISSIEQTAAVLAGQIARRLSAQETMRRKEWAESTPVRHFIVDDLLARADAENLSAQRPSVDLLQRKQSLREKKWVGVAIERYHPLIGGCLMAFQDSEVVRAIAAITGIESLQPDPSLYASGISLMEYGDFLNPHIDNSHDGDQRNYRALNLLFYVSPGWEPTSGGNLELWPADLSEPKIIQSRFNRLVVMATGNTSWHSVNRVSATEPRVCFSNYYFSPSPPGGRHYRNVTSFRGRPEEPVKRILLRLDSAVLNTVGRLFPSVLLQNKHRRR
jgi:Rps23 Pro-64 3,4-dihydroxylase Tpa1-like proline 4-hydroxylase